MIDTVVVPLDGSERSTVALSPAEALCRKLGAGLVLLRVTRSDEASDARADLETLILDRSLRSIARAQVEEQDRAADAIVAMSRAGALICMSTHGRTGIGRAVLGSVAEEALRQAFSPFLLVGPRYRADTGLGKAVLLAVDSESRSQQAAPLALEWSRLLNVPLWVLSVIDPADVASAERTSTGEQIDDSAHVHALASGLSVESGQEVLWETLHGSDAAEALIEFADDRDGLIVLATHGRRGLARLVLGSVTAHVVHHHSGLVLVSPPGSE